MSQGACLVANLSGVIKGSDLHTATPSGLANGYSLTVLPELSKPNIPRQPSGTSSFPSLLCFVSRGIVTTF